MRVQQQRERGAQGQRGVALLGVRVAEQEAGVDAGGVRLVGQFLACGGEDLPKALELGCDVGDDHDDRDEDEDVLDDADQRRCAQTAVVGVGGEQREGDDQRHLRAGLGRRARRGRPRRPLSCTAM